MSFRTTSARFDGDDPVDNATSAADKIRADLAGFPCSLVVFHASTVYDQDTIAAAMQQAFPDAVTMGCTTAGEGTDGKYSTGSVVVMAFGDDVLDVCRLAVVTESAAADSEDGVFSRIDDALAHIGDGLKADLRNLDYKQYVLYMLADRITPFSEALVERLGEVTDVFLVGGFAGDDYRFDNSQRIFYRGKAYANAAVLALWKPRRGFTLLKTQAVEPSDISLVVTRADERERIIWEFNGLPAAEVYAQLAGLDSGTMDARDFDENPLAASAGGELFLRIPIQTVDGVGLRMYASVKEGIRLFLTRSGDILNTTISALGEKTRNEGPFSAMLHTECVARLTALHRRNEMKEYSELFRAIPNIMVGSYGEVFIDIVAMTSTIILFK